MNAQSMPRPAGTQALRALAVALPESSRYSAPVAVNPAAGFGDPISKRRTGAIDPIAGAFFVPAMPCYGGRAWETFGSAGCLVAGSPTCVQLPPIRLATIGWQSQPLQRGFTMNHYIPLTAIDCLIPSLLIDTQSPPDVLHANAAARILAVTQALESLDRLELNDADSVDLKHLTHACAILLRDGCDLLDVLGRRLHVST